jgi:hypothetical protein
LDRFVLNKLEHAGLTPSPQADPRALLRRLYYDLIGLPPSADELAAFTADPTDARYEAAVDWLLVSPRFGERWARYWLDVARYADTKGYLFQEDRNYKQAYKYRDWVIDSFNQDLPYDDFLIAQLAADQLDDPQSIPAMGFLTLGRRFLNNRHDIINDRIDVVTRGLMGLTVACARCHDHKYDPISAADYYAMYGVFASSEEKSRDDAPPMLVDAKRPVDPVIFLRGSPGNRGPKVERRFLSCLVDAEKPPAFQHGRGRREYRQASDERAESAAIDPENRLHWRANRRRLDLESLRDSLVMAAGRLDLTLGGPSVQLTTEPFATRRAIYGFIERQNLPAFFRTFDFANPNTHTPERPQTVAPQQALFLMNSPFVIEQATHLAKHSEHAIVTNDQFSTSDDVVQAARIQRLFRLSLGREPTDDELHQSLQFVRTDNGSTTALTRWEQLAQVLMMSNEFAFVD